MRIRVLGAGVCFAALLTVPMGTAHAASSVTVHAAVDGRRLADSSTAHPVPLHPSRPMRLSVDVTNHRAAPVTVSAVRLEGRVIGLTFYSYDTDVRIEVAPGATETRHFQLDLSGLRGQATGLIPSSLQLLDGRRHVVASQAAIADVRGSWHSVYGVFGIAIAVLTALLFASAVAALARHRLPANRFWRGAQFLLPGIGLGLTIVFTLSAARILAPRNAAWIIIVGICAAVGLAVGYLTPPPVTADERTLDLTESAPDESVAASVRQTVTWPRHDVRAAVSTEREP